MANLKDPVSLADLAKELGLNKSKLNYYAWMGLLDSSATIGKTQLFEKTLTLKRIQKIQKLQDKGLTLKKIKSELHK